jgi:hypothetical protein
MVEDQVVISRRARARARGLRVDAEDVKAEAHRLTAAARVHQLEAIGVRRRSRVAWRGRHGPIFAMSVAEPQPGDDVAIVSAAQVRDAHQQVIDHLFVAGLGLQSMRGDLDGEPTVMIDGVLDQLDAAIRIIHELHFDGAEGSTTDQRSGREAASC